MVAIFLSLTYTSLPAASFVISALITFANSFDTTSVLISVETVGHSDSVSSGKNFLKKLILKEVNRRHKKHEKLPSIQTTLAKSEI